MEHSIPDFLRNSSPLPRTASVGHLFKSAQGLTGLGKKDISMVSTTGGELDGINELKDVFKESKNGGGLGARKALNDISNSAKPSALQASKRRNILSIGKGVDTNRTKFNAGKGGKKALTDLANSLRKPSVQLASQKGLDMKLNIPPCIAKEQFPHDHENCIKSQRRVMDTDCFLKEAGLDVPALLIPSLREAPKLCMKSAVVPTLWYCGCYETMFTCFVSALDVCLHLKDIFLFSGFSITCSCVQGCNYYLKYLTRALP